MRLPDRIRIETNGGDNPYGSVMVIDLDTGDPVEMIVHVDLSFEHLRLYADVAFLDTQAVGITHHTETFRRRYYFPDLALQYERPKQQQG